MVWGFSEAGSHGASNDLDLLIVLPLLSLSTPSSPLLALLSLTSSPSPILLSFTRAHLRFKRLTSEERGALLYIQAYTGWCKYTEKSIALRRESVDGGMDG